MAFLQPVSCHREASFQPQIALMPLETDTMYDMLYVSVA